MTEAVNIAGHVGLISLATLLVASAAGGLLMYLIDKNVKREQH